MNASVLPMKQNFRHEHAACVCQIRLIRRTLAFIDFKQSNLFYWFNSLLKQMIDMRMKNKVMAIGHQTQCNWLPNSMLLAVKLNAIER